MTDDSYAAGVREIEALRARLAHLEDIARQPLLFGGKSRLRLPGVGPELREVGGRGHDASPSGVGTVNVPRVTEARRPRSYRARLIPSACIAAIAAA